MVTYAYKVRGFDNPLIEADFEDVSPLAKVEDDDFEVGEKLVWTQWAVLQDGVHLKTLLQIVCIDRSQMSPFCHCIAAIAAFPYRKWDWFLTGLHGNDACAVWHLWQEFNKLPSEILLATHMKCFSCTMPTQPAQRMMLGVDRPTMQHRQILPWPENLYIRRDVPMQTDSTGNDASPATQHCCSAIRCPMSSDAMNLKFLAVPPSKIYRSRLVSNASWTIQI